MQSLNTFQPPITLSNITLKVSLFPLQYYHNLQFELSKLSDYSYIIQKIKSHFKSKCHLFILHLKTKNDALTIYSKNDWVDYYSNNIISSLIDSKRALKISIEELKQQKKFSQREIKEHNEKKIAIIIKGNSIEWFMNKMIEIFGKSKEIQKEFANIFLKETCIGNSKVEKEEVKSENLREVLVEKMKIVKEKIQGLIEVERKVKELQLEEKGEDIEVGSFKEYYNMQNRDTFHEKLVRESMEILDGKQNFN